MSENKVIIVGGFHEIIELCEKSGKEIIGLIDNNLSGTYLEYPVLGTDNDAVLIFEKYPDAPIIISPDSPKIREKLYELYKKIGFKFTSVISPNAIVSKSAKIGKGVIVQDGVNISAFAEIGKFVKLNSFSNIMHDVKVGDFVSVAPNTVVLGNVKISNRAYIGANSTILPNIIIGENSQVGAGAVVTKNIENNSVVMGVPAKRKGQ